MNSRHHPVARARLAGGIALVAAALLAGPARAAHVVDVRVGTHPTFTRVVFELDESAGYRIQRSDSERNPRITVTLEAAASTERLRSSGDIKMVRVEGGATTVAHVDLRQPGLRLKEMILANPPRIVLDVMRAAPPPAPAVKPRAPARVRETAPAPAPRPATEPATAAATPAPPPEPAPATKPAPKPAAPPAPAPRPATTPAKPAPRPAPATTELTPPPEERVPTHVPERAPAPSPPEPIQTAVPHPAVTPPLPPTRAPSGTAVVGTTPAAPEARPTPAAGPKPAPAVSRFVKPVPPAPKAVEPTSPTPRAARAAAKPGLVERWMALPWLIGGIAAALGLAIAGFVWMRRRRALPADIDVALADEGEDAGRVPAGGFSMGAVPDAEEEQGPLSSLFEPKPAPRPADTASQGDTAMSQDLDLPTARTAAAPPPVAAAGSGADVARLLQELERRVMTLESKLDESNEAREKLERQVAAQSEELRVQRAAIARTQRALRTMSRADEDKATATEPALRDGDTQAATRIKV